MPSGAWDRRATFQRLRTSEANRQRHGRLDPLTLVNMQPIPGHRHQTCQWIVQTGRRPIFCAAPVSAPGCSWCADHARIVFNNPEDANG